jgi:uncharacterized protein
MQKRLILVLVLLGTAWIASQPLAAQQTLTAVTVDAAGDKQFPPTLTPLTIPSHAIDMDAFFYLASGANPHGTVILLHGLPGYESNGDLAQSIRRAGWNVLLFHYRGTWGTAGAFSQASAIEDVAEVVRFLRDPANAAKYRVDPQLLVVIGHSFGGFLAAYEASHDPDIRAVAMISAVNLGKVNADSRERETRLRRWETQLHPVRGATASDLFLEAERHAKDWDYVQWAEALRTRPVLLVEADDQNRADMEALGSALRQNGAGAAEQTVATDHSFSDHRIMLQATVVRWLEELEASRPVSTPTQGPGSPESEVREALAKFIRAFNNLDWNSFRLAFDDDATVFYPRSRTIPGTEPVSSSRANGRAEFEKNFRLVFQQIRNGKAAAPYMDIQPKDMKIQMSGGVAIVTFHLDDGNGFLNRRTIVLTKTTAGWKIVHLHASEVAATSLDR